MGLLKQPKIFFGILFLAFLVRILFSLALEEHFYFADEGGYVALARHVLEGKGLRTWVPHGDASKWMPLYPLLVSLLLFFHLPLWTSVRIVQSLFDTMSCGLIFLTGRKLFGEQVAPLAGVLACFYPFLFFYVGFILSETLFTFFVLAFLSLWVLKIEKMDQRVAFFSGLFFGLGVLCRPILAGFLPFVVGGFFFPLSKGNRRASLSHVLVFLAVVLFCLAPWVFRNWKVHRAFVPLTTSGGLQLYQGNNPMNRTGGTRLYKPDDPANRPGEAHDYQIPEESKGMGEAERDRYFSKQALLFIYQNPGRTLSLVPKKLLRLWRVSPYPYTETFYTTFKVKMVCLLSYGLLLPFFLIGLWKARKTVASFPLYLFLGYMTLFHSIFPGSIRFRAPLEPLILIFGAFGLGSILERKRVDFS